MVQLERKQESPRNVKVEEIRPRSIDREKKGWYFVSLAGINRPIEE